MNVPTEEQHTVWTYNDSPEWTGRNAGIADMVVVDGQSHDRARWSAQRLAECFPEATFEVRDVHGTVTDAYGVTRTELRAEPVRYVPRRRRALGRRDG